MRPPVRSAGNQMMSCSPNGCSTSLKEPAFDQIVALHGESADVADIGDDIRRRHRALRIVLSQLFQECRLIPEHEQLIILRVPQIMNAYSAACAFTQIGNFSASVRPLLRIERAIVDRADRIGKCLGRDPIQADHVEPPGAGKCRGPAGRSWFDESRSAMTADRRFKISPYRDVQ